MAANFDHTDPSSPSAYSPSQTALLLLDFQNVVVNLCGDDGKAALVKAKMVRDWALSNNIFVLHSIIDGNTEPRATAKGRERMAGVLSMVKENPSAAHEALEIATDPGNDNAAVVYKQLGNISGLKAERAMDILRERNIRSLIVCGLSTSGAVLRASIGGADDGFVVTVIEDACADRVVGLHDMLVRHAMPMSVHVATAEDFVREYESRLGS